MTPAARIAAAIDLLDAIQGAPNRPADAVASDFFRSRRYIGSGDRRAVSERVWAVLRARRRIGWWLDDAPETPRLLVGASLLLEGWTRDGVAQAFSGGRFAPPALDRAEATALGRIEGHTLDHPNMPDAVRLEVPDWLLPSLRARFGDALSAEMAAMGQPATLDLRANLLKTTRDKAQAALAAEGWEARPTPLSPWGLRIQGRRPVTDGPAFQSGLVEIQDEGSQLIAAMVGAAPGMRVADWCAGAGGKTLALAAVMQNKGQIVACDVSAPRLEGAVRRLRRAGVHNVERHLTETGDKWLKRRAGSFDRVLVDAPCTGTGTWRRNPDARLQLTPKDLAELLEKQGKILDIAQTLVRKGGRLVYATCSVLEEENEDQVRGFLLRHPDFAVVPLAHAWPFETPVPVSGEFLALTPARHGTDGFFAAVLERAA
ncbi:MAG TPA: RsmB/NOP family class I SAM-dependent RNA methyltransferase [Rhodopila sp.]|uniref:RsmB/NOP family class I SAM-dependent RNA methyltransferase n=1 Tax=Rhodopila sp. TaxID=2480087 RepID=UPI002CD84B99|nr:RsmB/NOP family class I SAM-dependent RNA methyltransferase [Rhodopila sp.]HVY17181.1 RsmB/NOP family class I SAM-dependent RNA methyltransferase [Rhodopila sp.]